MLKEYEKYELTYGDIQEDQSKNGNAKFMNDEQTILKNLNNLERLRSKKQLRPSVVESTTCVTTVNLTNNNGSSPVHNNHKYQT